jgi:hypothetical protein
LDWPALLDSAAKVTVLTHSPEWLDRNLYTLRDIAVRRAIEVTIALPSKSGSFVAQIASQKGSTVTRIWEGLQDGIDRAATLWREAKSGNPGLHAGSRLSIVEHDYVLGYEVVTIDQTTIVTMAAPGDSAEIRERVAFVYEQERDEYPTNLFTAHIVALDTMSKLEEVVA